MPAADGFYGLLLGVKLAQRGKRFGRQLAFILKLHKGIMGPTIISSITQ